MTRQLMVTPDPATRDLLDRSRSGQPRAVARLISAIEHAGDADTARGLAELLAPFSGRCTVIGIAGPPGAGKSTLTSALIHALRDQSRAGGRPGGGPELPVHRRGPAR